MMKLKPFLTALALIFSLILTKISFAQAVKKYDKLPDGILIQLNEQDGMGARTIKFQVCSDNIIHVQASPDETVSVRPSLMVNKSRWEPADWALAVKDNFLEVTTSKLQLKINKNTGSAVFLDKNGKVLLKEKAEGGRVITPAEVMGENTFHIRQLFDSPEDEAFYGLGAHQNGIMNYKGHDVDLWQYNIVDVVPFLLSNNNYGILWDNNSRTKFGDIREYKPVSGLKLYSKDGKEGGLTAEYYTDAEFKNLHTSRIEQRIEHEFLDVNDPYPDGFEQNVKAVRWIGKMESAKNGIHKFRLYASSFIKVWIDGQLKVDTWRQNWLPWISNIKIGMKPGEKHTVKIEWIPSGGYIGFKYLEPEKEEIQNSISLYSEVADQIDYYFIHGDKPDQVISGCREITGKAPMMPKWAMGLWQCRERYKSQDELLSVVQEFRKRQIPLDNIVQDWFYWKEDQWGTHEFDSVRYPDPDDMVRRLHNDLNTNVMISVWPKFYTGTKNYEILNSNGWLYKRNVEKKQKDWVGPGYLSTFYDPYCAAARNLYWKQIDEKLFSKGFDAWWLDSTEPDIQSNLSFDEWRQRITPTALGTSARYLNTYSLMTCRGVYEGQRQSNPDKRVFILTRSAFAGQQRYAAAAWSGDIAARWDNLRDQIPAGLNFSLSGLPYWTTDIGGFAVEPRFERPANEDDIEEWRELNTRWFQFGTFCPLFRVHGQFPFREMFNIAPETHPAYKSMLAYDKLRYRLMPYIYSLTAMVTFNDYTIMRALVMDFGFDKKVHSIGNQFMFGPSMLINPVTGYRERSRNVYLPEGQGWYDLKTGRFLQGGKTVKAEAPYSYIPVYVREGSIIPVGPEIQYASEKPGGVIRLFVYTGKDCSFSLYEDENTNNNYEKGMYSTIPFSYNEKEKTLTIGKRAGEFPGMIRSRSFEIVWITKDKPSGFDFNKKPDASAEYNGTGISVKMK